MRQIPRTAAMNLTRKVFDAACRLIRVQPSSNACRAVTWAAEAFKHADGLYENPVNNRPGQYDVWRAEYDRAELEVKTIRDARKKR